MYHGSAVAATLRMFGDAHNPSPTRSVTPPARSQARSDEPEASKQPLVVPEIHPFAGTFAASEHTVAFGSKAFRSAFPLHVVALACRFSLSVATFVTSVTFGSTKFQRATDMLFLGLPLLGLSARIAVHRWNCLASAQRVGATAWTILVAGDVAVDVIVAVVDSHDLCEVVSISYLYPMLAILFAVVNASHGMEFWHTASLGGLVLCDFIAVRTVCAHHTSVNLAIVALVFTYGAGHFAQLLARHAFLRSERLEHDVHRLECLLTGPRGAQLPTVVVPTESSSARDSTTIASAPQQDDRSALSAPAATDGGHNALPAGLVLRGCPPPHTSHPSTAGPSTAGPSTAGPSTAADPLSASGPLCNTLSASVPLSSVSRLNSQALLNAPATSNPGPDPHPAPRTHTTPSPYLDPNPKPSPTSPGGGRRSPSPPRTLRGGLSSWHRWSARGKRRKRAKSCTASAEMRRHNHRAPWILTEAKGVKN